MCWHVYIVKCSDGTFYTGVAKDLARRLVEHNSSKLGSKYTRARRPVELVFSEESASRSEACKREVAIKNLTRIQKIGLINQPE
ncbi:MAG: GIY-YIG nuclease family protein [Gammaproteobacteria bacterium]|nr:GIY-YIG nuclease family protein [Gammaproteobacteria bacterium]